MRVPWHDLQWAIIAKRHAKSPAHVDTLPTVMRVVTGAKIVAMAVRSSKLPVDDGLGHLSSRHFYDEWDSYSSNTKTFDWEFFLLLPGMTL